jgi:hypothetical protein
MKNTRPVTPQSTASVNFTDAEIVEVGGYNSFAVEGDADLSALDDDFFNADDEDFENAGGRRKGCKELGLKGKKLRQCAKDLKKAGYTKGGEIPESVMKKYAPQLIEKAASEMPDAAPKAKGAVNKGLSGGLKKAASVSAVSDTSASEKLSGMSTPKKAAIGIGVVVAILVVGLIIRRVTAAKA